MKIALTYIQPLNSFILEEPACEGIPKGSVRVRSFCTVPGSGPTGIQIELPDQNEHIAKLIESSTTDRETNALLTETLERLEIQIAELTEKLGKYEGQAEAPRAAGRSRKDK